MAESSFDPEGVDEDGVPWNVKGAPSALEGDEVMMEMVGICHVCAERTTMFPPYCNAFPDGIPTAILVGDFLHTKPFPGDHGILFKHKGGLNVDVET